jgi:hypothetical protein
MLWPKRPPTPSLLALAERGSLVPQYGVMTNFVLFWDHELADKPDFAGSVTSLAPYLHDPRLLRQRTNRNLLAHLDKEPCFHALILADHLQTIPFDCVGDIPALKPVVALRSRLIWHQRCSVARHRSCGARRRPFKESSIGELLALSLSGASGFGK